MKKQERLQLMLSTLTGETLQFPAMPFRRGQKCASTDETRLALTGLLLTTDGKLYASDGYVLYEDDLGIDLDEPMLVKIHAPIPKSALSLSLHFLSPTKGHAHCKGKEDAPEKILAFDLLPSEAALNPDAILEDLKDPPYAIGHVTISGSIVGLVEEVYPGGATWTFRGPEAPIEIRTGEDDDESRMVIMPMKVG